MNSLKLIWRKLKVAVKPCWPEPESQQQRQRREEIIQTIILTGLN